MNVLKLKHYGKYCSTPNRFIFKQKHNGYYHHTKHHGVILKVQIIKHKQAHYAVKLQKFFQLCALLHMFKSSFACI